VAAIKLLHVSTSKCYPQGPFQQKGIQHKSNTLVYVLYRHYWNDQNIKMLELIKLTSTKCNVVMLKLHESEPFQVRSRSCLYSVSKHVRIFVIRRDLVQTESVKCVV
jgi:uncharacterized protein YcfL